VAVSERDPDQPVDAGDPDEVAEIIEELEEHPDLPEADVIEQHRAVPDDDEYDLD
jgi:hypothetical protein